MVARSQVLRNMFLALLLTAVSFSLFACPLLAAVGRPIRLIDVKFVDQGGRLRMGLCFNGKPKVTRVSSGDKSLLVLDFEPVVFPKVRQRRTLKGRVAKEVLIAQNDRRKVRLALRWIGTGLERVPRGLVRGAKERHMTYWLDVGEGTPPGATPDDIIRRALAASSDKVHPAAAAVAEEMNKKDAARKLPQRKWVVVIDPGHGGKDPGASGKLVHEKEIVLAVGLEIARVLDRVPGVEVHMTRTKDRFVRLARRSTIADESSADLFVSLHCNSCRNPRTQGLEIYTLSRDGASDEIARGVADKENSVLGLEGADANAKGGGILTQILCSMMMTDTLNQSCLLAGFLEKSLKDRRTITFRGHRKANFYVLRLIKIPSVLIELGFLSNKAEEKRMMGRAYVASVAARLAEGLCRYLAYIMMREGEYAQTLATSGYVVKAGDTLGSIAERFETTVPEIMRLNGLKNRHKVGVGQLLRVPTDPIAQLLWGKTE